MNEPQSFFTKADLECRICIASSEFIQAGRLHANSNAGVFHAYLDKPALKLKNVMIIFVVIFHLHGFC